MGEAIALILTKMVPLGFVGGAIYLAANSMAGWGWFILGAVLTFTYPGRPCDEDEDEAAEPETSGNQQ